MDKYEELIIDIKRTSNRIGKYEIEDRKNNAYYLFNKTFSKEMIEYLDAEKTQRFFFRINKLMGIRVRSKIIIQDLEHFKTAIIYFLYGEDPIDVRINNVLHFERTGKYPYKIIGIQRVPTILLHMSDPNNYCIWNDKVQTIFFKRNLLIPINDSWSMYQANNEIQHKIMKDTSLDLFAIDYIIRNIR